VTNHILSESVHRCQSVVRKPIKRFLQALLGLTVLSTPLAAESEWNISGGITSTFQTASDDRVDSEVLASADLVIQRSFKNGDLRLYIEGNSTPGSHRVSAILPEVNTDAGSALDKNRKGRIQVSELAYHHVFNDHRELTAGLIDITSYFDQSRIASDENTQFLAVSFVQNPTIDFPDYTLGAVYDHNTDHGLVLRLGLTSSNGLADNPNLSYAQLLDVDESDKGVFVITSAAIRKPYWYMHVGTWAHTAPHPRLYGTREDLMNYGAYAVGGYQAPFGAISFRFGLANEAVSLAEGFAAIIYQYEISPITYGIGLGRVFLSDHEPNPEMDNLSHFETYLRWNVTTKFIATVDLQHLANSSFDSGDTIVDSYVTVYGVRLTIVWD